MEVRILLLISFIPKVYLYPLFLYDSIIACQRRQSDEKKLGAVQYLAYVTFILIIFSILSGEAFATSSLSKNENGNQYADESIVDTENYEKDSSEDTNNVTENYSYKNLQGEDRTRIQDKDKFSAYKSEKKADTGSSPVTEE